MLMVSTNCLRRISGGGLTLSDIACSFWWGALRSCPQNAASNNQFCWLTSEHTFKIALTWIFPSSEYSLQSWASTRVAMASFQCHSGGTLRIWWGALPFRPWMSWVPGITSKSRPLPLLRLEGNLTFPTSQHQSASAENAFNLLSWTTLEMLN